MQVIQDFNSIMRFKVLINHVYVQVRRDLDQQWLTCEFNIDQQEVEKIISNWLVEWRIPIMKEEIKEEQ